MNFKFYLKTKSWRIFGNSGQLEIFGDYDGSLEKFGDDRLKFILF